MAQVSSGRPACGAYMLHSRRPCNENTCKRSHYYVQQMMTSNGMANKQQIGIKRAISSLDNEGANCLFDMSTEDVVRGVKDASADWMCSAWCTCSCHACDSHCAEYNDVSEPNSDVLRGGVTGIRWELLSVDTRHVYLPSFEQYFPVSIVHEAICEWLRSGQALPVHFKEVNSSELQDVRYVGMDGFGSCRRMASAQFICAHIQTMPITHDIVVGIDETESESRIAIRVEEAGQVTLMFPLPFNGVKCHPKEMVEEAGSGGYMTFLAHMVQRNVMAGHVASFVQALDAQEAERSMQSKGVLDAATDHIVAAMRLMPTESLVKIIRKHFQSITRGRKTARVHPKHTWRTQIEALRLHERVFCGVVDPNIMRVQDDIRASTLRRRRLEMHTFQQTSIDTCVRLFNTKRMKQLHTNACDDLIRHGTLPTVLKGVLGEAGGTEKALELLADPDWDQIDPEIRVLLEDADRMDNEGF
jgi:hypothetical protein